VPIQHRQAAEVVGRDLQIGDDHLGHQHEPSRITGGKRRLNLRCGGVASRQPMRRLGGAQERGAAAVGKFCQLD
jgi:hypothetical protein